MEKTYQFNSKKAKKEIVDWLRDWFDRNGKGCNAVVAISGGKDSTVTAALCVEALGKERVVGVMIPCGKQKDIEDSIEVCKCLGIKNYTINIKGMNDSLVSSIVDNGIEISDNALTNINPRLRMAVTYAVSQSLNGRVVNTSNFSEYALGYFTLNGDNCGDCRPLINLTCTEVVALGDEFENIPSRLIHKTPEDGLPKSKPDEEKFGFSYQALDDYIRKGTSGNSKTDELIRQKVDKVSFKHRPVESFDPKGCIEIELPKKVLCKE